MMTFQLRIFAFMILFGIYLMVMVMPLFTSRPEQAVMMTKILTDQNSTIFDLARDQERIAREQ